MPLGRAREILAAVRSATQRRPIVQSLYIVSFCLIYLMPNVWAARTLFFYIAIPLALIGLNYTLLRSTLRHPIFVFTAVYLTILILTSLVAPDVRAKVIGDHLLNSIRVLLLLVITADLIGRDESFLKKFGVFLSVAAAAGAVINIIAFYGDPKYANVSLWDLRLLGVPGVTVYYNPNVVGAIFAIACVAGASVLLSGTLNRIETGLVLVATSILLVPVFLTQSRSSIMGVCAGLAAVAVLRLKPLNLLWLGLAGCAVLAGLLLWTPIYEVLAARGASLRPMLWAYYWNLALERLWVGYGLSYDMTLRLPNVVVALNAHNIMLSALVRGGALAAVTLICLVVTCLRQSWTAWRTRGVLMPLALMVTATVATTVDHEMTATSLGWPWLLFWIPVAMCLGVGVREQPRGAAVPLQQREAVRS